MLARSRRSPRKYEQSKKTQSLSACRRSAASFCFCCTCKIKFVAIKTKTRRISIPTSRHGIANICERNIPTVSVKYQIIRSYNSNATKKGNISATNDKCAFSPRPCFFFLSLCLVWMWLSPQIAH